MHLCRHTSVNRLHLIYFFMRHPEKSGLDVRFIITNGLKWTFPVCHLNYNSAMDILIVATLLIMSIDTFLFRFSYSQSKHMCVLLDPKLTPFESNRTKVNSLTPLPPQQPPCCGFLMFINFSFYTFNFTILILRNYHIYYKASIIQLDNEINCMREDA